MHYYQHHVGDYQRDTSALSILEHGVYRLLMDEYYVTERPLPPDLDALCRICRAMSKAERLAVGRVVDKFFHLSLSDGGFWRHRRIDAEIADYRASVNNGKRGGRPKGKPKANLNHNLSANLNESPPITNHKPVTNNHIQRERAREGEWLERILEAYPPKTHQGEALDAIRSSLNRGHPPEEIWQGVRECAAVIRAAEQKAGGPIRWVPNPASFFRAETWKEPLRLAEQLKPKNAKPAPVGRLTEGQKQGPF